MSHHHTAVQCSWQTVPYCGTRDREAILRSRNCIGPKLHHFDLSWIRCTTSCTINPQQMESLQQIHTTTICSQRCYLLKCLKGQGLPAKQLNVVFCAIVMSRILFALPAWFLSYDLVAKFDAFSKKLFAGVTAVRWDVCLCYCLRRMRNCSVKWLTIRNIVFTSYYLRKKNSTHETSCL